MRDFQTWRRIGTTRNSGDVDLTIRDVFVVFEDRLILRVPVRNGAFHVTEGEGYGLRLWMFAYDFADYLHAEGFVTLLQTASGEPFECVNVLAVDDAGLLTNLKLFVLLETSSIDCMYLCGKNLAKLTPMVQAGTNPTPSGAFTSAKVVSPPRASISSSPFNEKPGVTFGK